MKAKWPKITGLVLHILIAALMLAAGSAKVLGLIPREELEKLGPIGQQIWLIGTGEIITAVLLVIPRTSSLGILLASGFWGGAICFHMSRSEDYLMQSALLLLTWVGAYLRIPATFSSFWGSPARSPQVAEHSEPALR
jgi:NADH:ubiquinone oxidoreductase subunit 2 (subunit N)